MKNVVLAFGTRPEATKMAPVYLALRERQQVEPLVLVTGQHREQLEDGMRPFGLRADANLDVMMQRQSLPDLAGRIIPAAAAALQQMRADYVLVHGDTLTTFAVAWAAFLSRIPVGHVEAGLRSHNMEEPFPEEANRRLTDVLTDLDFAPTELSRDNLLAEGKSADRILVTGQTAVDAIRYVAKRSSLPAGLPRGPFVTVTMHRRENIPVLPALAGMLAEVASAHPELTFVYPVHLNPAVREAVVPVLSKVSNVVLSDPLDYGAMAALLAASVAIVTDSGGLQEEGASLGVPVAVLRNVTERPEGLASGIVRLASNEAEKAGVVITELLADRDESSSFRRVANPYGDGAAGQRIAQAVAWRLGAGEKPRDWVSPSTD